jgi:glycosyltransferase involved in cell wall biosynthesis
MQSRAENCYLVTHIVNGMPLVTVVTPCYNAEPFIGETIESVQSQTFEDWEHIVVDDGSTDASADIVRGYIDADTTGRLRLCQQTNQGVNRARNHGLQRANLDSKYVLFLDADDCLKPNMLSALTSYLNVHKDVGLVYCLFDKVDADGKKIDGRSPRNRYRPTRLWMEAIPETDPETPPLAVFEGKIIPSVSLVRKRFLPTPCVFDEVLDIQPDEDADAFTRVALRAPVHQMNRSLVKYRVHSSQSTQNQSGTSRKRLLKKWSTDIEGLTTQEQRSRRKLWYDYQGKVIPRIWMQASKQRIKQRQYLIGSLFLVGAVLRYGYFGLRRAIT